MSGLLQVWEHVDFVVGMAAKYRAERRNFVGEYLANARRYEAEAAEESEPNYRAYLIARARFARLAVGLARGAKAASIYQTGLDR